MCNKVDLSLHVPERAIILEVHTISATEKLFKLALATGKELGHTTGQFIEITIPNIGSAPISITSSPTDKGYFELGVRAIEGGNVTPVLHRMKAGDAIFVSKPMGNGFPVDELIGKDLILAAGGIGLFPLRSLIRHVRVNRFDFGKVTILFGAKNPDERLLPKEIEMWKRDSFISFYETVDNGTSEWKGNIGLITKLFAGLENIDAPNTRVIAIGPDRMFQGISDEVVKFGIVKSFIFASTERKMSCGLGFCRNCLREDGKLACQETVDSAQQLCF